MKATGIVRKLDYLGRVCLPKELRRKLHISDDDAVEIYVDGESIVLKKYDAAGDMEQLLDNLERSIKLLEPMVPAAKMRKLMVKVKDMRRILAEN